VTTRLAAPAVLIAMVHLGTASANAQTASQPVPTTGEKPVTQAPRARPLTSLDVQVVITRQQGQKQISSLPYSLAVTANATNAAQLNMGTDVPVPSTTITPAAPAAAPEDKGKTPPAAQKPVVSFSYRSVGTSISCRATGGDDGRFEVSLEVDDSSVFTSEQAPPPMQLPGVPGPLPVFRNFRTRNTLILQDGQSRRFTAAADRVSGETVQVEVTLRVVK
jgi:hypothetical protein